MADRLFGYVKNKSNEIISTVQQHVSSLTDTTGTLAKQKLLQTLFSSGVVKNEHIRKGLQIGINHFLQLNEVRLDYIQRVKFPASGTNETPKHDLGDFDVEAYGLAIFINLIDAFGVDKSTLQTHICKDELREIINPSSSGSLLYLTSNSTFIIKTLRDYDAKFIEQKFLHEYYRHIKSTENSYIAKLFGCFGYIPYLSQEAKISIDPFTLRFAIFSNIIPTYVTINEKYDLKGSTYKRDANTTEKLKKSITFKDNDFCEIHPKGLTIPAEFYSCLKDTLTKDVEFLQKLNIMDYSLLLAIHNMDNKEKPTRATALESLCGNIRDTFLIEMEQNSNNQSENAKSFPKLEFKSYKPVQILNHSSKNFPILPQDIAQSGAIPALNEHGERLFVFCGIIDILQTYDICKYMQTQYQTMENPNVVQDRSIVDANLYATRFKKFMFERVFHPAAD